MILQATAIASKLVAQYDLHFSLLSRVSYFEK